MSNIINKLIWKWRIATIDILTAYKALSRASSSRTTK